MNAALAQFVLGLPYGFLTLDQLPGLVSVDRLCPVLVRCGGGRFTCPARNVAHFVALIERDEREYVRDLSIPASVLDEARQDQGRPFAGCAPLPKLDPLPPLAAVPRLIPADRMFSEPANPAPVRCAIRGTVEQWRPSGSDQEAGL